MLCIPKHASCRHSCTVPIAVESYSVMNAIIVIRDIRAADFCALETCKLPSSTHSLIDDSRCHSKSSDRSVAVNRCQLQCIPGYSGSVDAVCDRPGSIFKISIDCKGSLLVPHQHCNFVCLPLETRKLLATPDDIPIQATTVEVLMLCVAVL